VKDFTAESLEELILKLEIELNKIMDECLPESFLLASRTVENWYS